MQFFAESSLLLEGRHELMRRYPMASWLLFPVNSTMPAADAAPERKSNNTTVHEHDVNMTQHTLEVGPSYSPRRLSYSAACYSLSDTHVVRL